MSGRAHVGLAARISERAQDQIYDASNTWSIPLNQTQTYM